MDTVKLLQFDKRTDIRGVLIPFEACKNIPFPIERIFFIKDLDDHPRGFHAHKITAQILIPITGSFKVELTDGQKVKTFELQNDNIGVFVPANVWLHMYDYSPGTVICVICSHEYDETEYIRNYGDYLEYVSNLQQKQIQCFDLTCQTQSLFPQLSKAINRVLKRNEYVLGSDLKEFEVNFAAYLNINYCVGYSNGTSAMICALKALELPVGSEIIIQSNSYIAAPLAVSACGYDIKIVDIDETLNIDLSKLEEVVTEKTKVVLIVHLYGACPDMDRLMDLKSQYGFYLIEDCAQAHGSRFRDQYLGTFGELGCFSFYPSKNLGSAGEGGCIVTNNEAYAIFARKYRNYGSLQKYVWELKGANERMQNIQAAVLNVKLPYLEQWNQQRRALATMYNKRLVDIPQITIPEKQPQLQCNYHIYCVLAEDRTGLIDHLKKNGVNCAIHYPETFYKSPAYKEYCDFSSYADQVKGKLLSLPMYPELDQETVKRICQLIHNYYLYL